VGDRHRPLARRAARARAARALAALALVALVAPPAGAGSITGRVVFRGAPPALPPIEVAKDRETCGESVPAEALVVAADGGVKFAVVSVEGARAAGGGPAGEVTLENRGCRFTPHVLAARVGAEIAIVNADPLLHNLRAWADEHRHVFNVVQPTQGQVTRRTLKRGGAIALSCDTHVHMAGWLHAFDHPYYAVTGGDGSFQIEGVPAGTYRLQAWHEGWTIVGREPNGRLQYDAPRLLTREVVVPATGAIRVLFELSH
jgi:plastocyanin